MSLFELQPSLPAAQCEPVLKNKNNHKHGRYTHRKIQMLILHNMQKIGKHSIAESEFVFESLPWRPSACFLPDVAVPQELPFQP